VVYTVLSQMAFVWSWKLLYITSRHKSTCQAKKKITIVNVPRSVKTTSKVQFILINFSSMERDKCNKLNSGFSIKKIGKVWCVD
jgi:hypothetical protein